MSPCVVGIPRSRLCFVVPALVAVLLCAAGPILGAETIGGAIYTDLGNPLTSGLEGVTVTVTGAGGTFSATTAGAQGLWSITDVPEGTYTVTPCMAGKKFEHIVGGVSDGLGAIQITVDSTPANRQANQSIQFLAGDGVGNPDAGQSTVEATASVQIGTPATATITARDACGNAIPGVAAAQVVVAVDPDTGVTITQPSAATNGSGQTTASISFTEKGTYTVSATIGGTLVTDTATVEVSSGPPAQLVFSVQPAGPYQAGETFSVEVTVQDVGGNTVTSYTDNVAIAAGGKLQPSDPRTQAAVAGVANFSGLSINEVGNYALTATSGALPPATSNAFTVNHGDPAQLAFITSPGDTPAMGTLSPTPQVGIYDNFGNLATSATGTIDVDLTPATGTLSGDTSVDAVDGVASFGGLSVGPPGTFPGTFQLNATSGALASGTSTSFEVTADPALVIEKTDSADPVDPNTEVEYTISYDNLGLGDATNCVITETLPAGLQFVSAADGGVYDAGTGAITWDVGGVASEAGGIARFTARVDPNMLDGGQIVNDDLTMDCTETNPVDQDSPETTTINDQSSPTITLKAPQASAIQVPLNNIVEVGVTDNGGVDYDGNTVEIYIEGDLIYDGANETNVGVYDSTGHAQAIRGICRRTGSLTDYTFTFVPSVSLGYEKKIDVHVTASDETGNAATADFYFWTLMRSFGANAQVNSDADGLVQDNPATVVDSQGNIWVVWDQTSALGDTDIYVGALLVDANAFTTSVPVAATANNESHPGIALDANDVAYVVWQADDPNGFWDVYISSSSDGVTWSAPAKVNVGDPNNTSDQTAPGIAIDRATPNNFFVAWEDSRSGNPDIWLGTSTGGGPWAEMQLTSDAASQTEPGIAVDPNDEVAIIWTDARNAATTGTDIYGTSSYDPNWTPIRAVDATGNQSSPTGALADLAHLLWVSDVGGYGDIMYGNDTAIPVVGVSIIDEPNTVQSEPALAAHSSSLFACWTDARNVVSGNGDTDIYFAESSSPFGTNLLVNDDTGTSAQAKPAIGVDMTGNPYMVWVDGRNGNADIYYAGSTALDSLAVSVQDVNGVVTVSSTAQPNLQVEIPAGALPDGVDANEITISEISNLPELPSVGGFGLVYDFGPSGAQFDPPVTIRIPIAADAPVYASYRIYRYDPASDTWTEDGIHNPATKVTDAGGTYLEVLVDHFTVFGTGGTRGGGGGGGGGCALTPSGHTSAVEFALPFIAYVLVLFGVTVLDRRRRAGGRAQ